MKSKHKNQTINPPVQGGYSLILMWPCYLGFSISIFILGSVFGLGWSIFLVSIVAFLVAIKIESRQPKIVIDSERYSADLEKLSTDNPEYVLPSYREYAYFLGDPNKTRVPDSFFEIEDALFEEDYTLRTIFPSFFEAKAKKNNQNQPKVLRRSRAVTGTASSL